MKNPEDIEEHVFGGSGLRAVRMKGTLIDGSQTSFRTSSSMRGVS
jgi:hypothetical protein